MTLALAVGVAQSRETLPAGIEYKVLSTKLNHGDIQAPPFG